MSARLKGRRDEVERLVGALRDFVRTRDDVTATAVVGSYAYDRPRMGSDVDLLILTSRPDAYGEWLGEAGPLAPAQLIRHQQWGQVTEWRFRRRSGLHVEIGIGPTSWADADPVDPGTARVVRDGLHIVHDPLGLLSGLRTAVCELTSRC